MNALEAATTQRALATRVAHLRVALKREDISITEINRARVPVRGWDASCLIFVAVGTATYRIGLNWAAHASAETSGLVVQTPMGWTIGRARAADPTSVLVSLFSDILERER